MNFSRRFSILVIVAASFLGGCASTTPMREFMHLGTSNASKISITSEYEANILNKNAVLPGKIYVNSVYYGDFSKNQRDFSLEVLPGTYLVVICPGTPKCINAQINILPNKNYKFKYTQEKQYRVIMLNYVWKLIPTGVEDYFPNKNIATPSGVNNKTLPADSKPQSNNILTNPQVKPIGKTMTDVDSKMEVSKTRCLALGFKVGTQSFGECILRLSK